MANSTQIEDQEVEIRLPVYQQFDRILYFRNLEVRLTDTFPDTHCFERFSKETDWFAEMILPIWSLTEIVSCTNHGLEDYRFGYYHSEQVVTEYTRKCEAFYFEIHLFAEHKFQVQTEDGQPLIKIEKEEPVYDQLMNLKQLPNKAYSLSHPMTKYKPYLNMNNQEFEAKMM